MDSMRSCREDVESSGDVDDEVALLVGTLEDVVAAEVDEGAGSGRRILFRAACKGLSMLLLRGWSGTGGILADLPKSLPLPLLSPPGGGGVAAGGGGVGGHSFALSSFGLSNKL